MNAIAEKGLAAHWKYKEGAPRPQESKLDAWLQQLRDVLSNHKDSDTLDFMQDFKLDLFSEEIYVYTPKGDMRVLPKGATALDFAFDIHSELGARCIGAKVNYKLVPLSHPLKSGDQIEVISSSKQKPGDDWLNLVITAKAKSRIKYYLKEQKREIAEDGKEIVERKLKHLGVSLSSANAHELAVHFKKQSPTDVYYAIAIGNIDVKELKEFKVVGDRIFAPEKIIEVKPIEISEDETLKKPAKGAELVIFGESSDKILYKLANCCQPIPGDDVFGFITAGEGLKIHRSDCPNAARLLSHYGHRVVKTKWAKNKEISFLSGVRITGLDDVGVIKKITNIISDSLNMNMRSISIDTQDGLFEGTIMVYVHDREEFDHLCNQLSSLEGIITVERIETSEM
jgi:GTP pyrophosphokinase